MGESAGKPGNIPHAPFLIDGLEDLILGGSVNGRPATKVTTAYGSVRRAIVTHELPASQLLDEAWLRSRFDIGRTPLREALKRLAHEKFLIWSAHQAPMVRDIAVDELPRLYEMRILLETHIATLAASRATQIDDQRLEQILDLLAAASARDDTYQSVELDFALHAAIAQSTRNRFLREASDSLDRQSLRLWFLSQSSLGMGLVGELHRQLAGAIMDRDPERARSLALDHAERSIERQDAIQRLGAAR